VLHTLCFLSMNIAIYTNNLSAHNGHLMPWRTVLEVTANLGRSGHKALVFSGNCGDKERVWRDRGTRIKSVPKPSDVVGFNRLAAICRDEEIGVLYWPLDWSKPRTDVLQLENAGRRVIWYVPGAYYRRLPVLKAVPYVGLRALLPYLAQAVIPKRYYVRRLMKNGVRPLIMMTDYSRDMAIRAGYPERFVWAIPPGKAPLISTGDKPHVFEKVNEKIGGRPYFLFFGPPQAIRGVEHILKAFKQVARKNTGVCLVCLFREDKGLDAESLRERIQGMKLGEQVICVWRSVNNADIDLFLRNCYAVLKPFLLVPSEIPLAVIEAAGYGKPVISTGPDGTGCFAEKFGLMVPPANSRALSGAMLSLLNDRQLYEKKCDAAARVYADHPTWENVAEQWLQVAEGLCHKIQLDECLNGFKRADHFHKRYC